VTPAGVQSVPFNLVPRHQTRSGERLGTESLGSMCAPYGDGIVRASLPLPRQSILAWAVRPGTAPRRISVRADASAGVATARFTLRLTLDLVPKHCLMALAASVLHPGLLRTLSYSVSCLIGMMFHIIVLPAFSSRRIRSPRWIIEGIKKSTLIKSKYIYM
jgi:hypothetical protein